jgi:hypothetical protein
MDYINMAETDSFEYGYGLSGSKKCQGNLFTS